MHAELIAVARNPQYRHFWVANILSNGAIWIQNTTSSIALTHLSTSAVVNSLVQVAATLPFLLFGILAGQVGDKYSKPLVLTVAQLSLGLVSLTLAAATWWGLLSPALLVGVTAAFSVATVFRMPVAQAGIALTVPRDQVRHAAVLNNLGFNIARAVGPAIAGSLLLALAYFQVYLLTAAMLLAVAAYFLYGFYHERNTTTEQTEFISFRDTWKHIYTSTLFRRCTFDACILFFAGSVIWSMMPFIAKYHLNQSTAGQGSLMGATGLGALLTVVVLPAVLKFRRNHHSYWLCYSLMISSIAAIWLSSHLTLIFVALMIFGLSWSMAVTLLNGEIQSSFLRQMLSRVIAIYLIVMYLAQAAGSLWAGLVSQFFETRAALMCSVVVLALGLGLRTLMFASTDDDKE
ncbi:MFS transporter [Photobacterium sp. CCB-ST2H9]|uniref:MFS transporter n=1 Tax=Photobacterium sp. CCB-ST2H9 TaxID=2912855 RepID=UPI0020038301|nr:MFS transporter [Photobacterium sp. CCB-ST2H9]UTM60308.1 MFS transporter [Photobacterium sp. CCB-ST2H9]